MAIGRILALVVLIIPSALLAVGGVARVADGRARDAALPVPSAMLAGIALPVGAYSAAAENLKHANPTDGEASIVRGEALLRAGKSPEARIQLFRSGLAQSPALVMGWTLLALDQSYSQPRQAALALSQALVLAPNDFWVAGLRATAASIVWPNLDLDAREEALRQTRLLWTEPSLRPQLYKLLAEPGGPALVKLAFVGRRDDLIEINRWTSAQSRSMTGQP